MARCSWLICIGLIFLFSSAAVASGNAFLSLQKVTKLGNLYPFCFFFCGTESLSNATRTTGNVTAERDGRAYDVHPPDSTNNEGMEVVQSLSPRPKSLGSK